MGELLKLSDDELRALIYQKAHQFANGIWTYPRHTKEDLLLMVNRLDELVRELDAEPEA
jgi:hypothetical protein